MSRSSVQPRRAAAAAPAFRATSGGPAPTPGSLHFGRRGDAGRTSEWSSRAEASVLGGPSGFTAFPYFLCPQKPGTRMAGLEVLFASAAPAITCAQDALVCFLHWEVVTHGYYALGTGDQVRHGAGSGSGGEGVRCLLPKPVGPKAWSKAPVLSSLPSSEPGVHDPMGVVPK